MKIDQATLDLLAKTAAEDAAKSYSFLKFTRESGAPEWKTGDVFTTDAEAIIRTDEAARSYMRFAAGTKPPVEETPWVLALGNERPKRPASFTDESKWDAWTGGRPKDPWVYRTRVPVQITTGPAAGRIVLFNGDNAASRDLISEIQVYFAKTGKRPLVLLTHVKDGNDIMPAFEVIRLTEDNATTPGLNHHARDPNAEPDEKLAANPAEKPEAYMPPPQVNGGGGGFDDEIPFAAEFR